ncbi:MAG: hypothetical protein Q9181_004251 [Wetmoreana brouardii]
MSLSGTLTFQASSHAGLMQLSPIAQKNEPVNILDLPVELRLEIYSYLFPDVDVYTTGISEPGVTLKTCLRKDKEPADPGILSCCRKIYQEAVPLLYHKRCFNFDIAGHLLRSVANHRSCITSLNFRSWLGLSSYFKQPWPAYDVDNLDWTRLEEIRVTFWPVNGCPLKLEDARVVTTALCRELQQARGLKKVSIMFRDESPEPRVTTVGIACRKLTEMEYLLQPFQVLRVVEQVRIEMPATFGMGDDGTMQVWLRCMAQVEALMGGQIAGNQTDGKTIETDNRREQQFTRVVRVR